MEEESVFKRHRKKMLALIITLSVLILDVTAAQLLKLRRALRDRERLAAEQSYRLKHDLFDHSLAPNKTIANAVWGSARYKIATNSLGFKDASPRKVPLKANQRRVLFIGDSFTEGVGLEYPQTFVGRISAAWSNRSPPIEVLNAGVVSYCPAIYFAKTHDLLENLKLEFHELVVLIDISDAQNDLRYVVEQSDGVVRIKRSRRFENKEARRSRGFFQIAKDGISSNTVLIYLSLKLLKDLALGPPAPKDHKAHLRHLARWTYDKKSFDDFGRAGLAQMTRNMERLHKLAKRHKLRLSVAVYPWPYQIQKGDIDSIQVRHWERWTEEHGLGFINLFPAFINDEPSATVIEKYFIKNDVHWNEAGHARVADVLLERYKPGAQGD